MISNASKMRSSDRVLVLKVIDDKKPLSSHGMIDSRLFKGENKLRAVMDPATTFWTFKYDQGILPEPLKCQFTSFSILKKHATDYFKTRNIEIVEVKD